MTPGLCINYTIHSLCVEQTTLDSRDRRTLELLVLTSPFAARLRSHFLPILRSTVFVSTVSNLP
ncbi:hypothetical protein N656DRAFT_782886 [Canariomyces notabilis]|uniref:Uncharacterized protein n=1 Tax=Canariomyces notabilis TaxID=2074819 RepID=A0AAN6T9U6_9PEZI|nr:hypothetical protein N656DRAFT_782886 [Canariomyces arenarius]